MKPLALLAAAFLAGCASVDANQCANAYELGFRDAIFGLQRQDNVYGPLCERQNARLDLARYAQGWQEGLYEFEQRTVHSVD